MGRKTGGNLGGVSLAAIRRLAASEARTYAARRPGSARASRDVMGNWLGGVPMHWMLDWPMPFPFLVSSATGASLTDIDGNRLDDFCLGDTASMFGHSPPAIARAIAARSKRGLATMLPGDDAPAVGALLAERFGLPIWQIATTATDANRFALRVARAATGRSKILVFNGCYHGTVDETFVRLIEGKPANRPGLAGEWRELWRHTKVVEFNDIAALETALAARDVACVIAEPVMTNSCMVLPQPGYLKAMAKLARRHGALLLIDETHTISSGPAGHARAEGVTPDLFVLGKAVAGGLPAAIWGMSAKVARAYERKRRGAPGGHSGLGTTLSGNPLQLAAMRATLLTLMTQANYARMNRLAARSLAGLSAAIGRHRLPWHALRVGARVEFVCAPGPLLNGSEAEAAHAPQLEQAVHLALLNRGCLIAPFHNMMLVCPATKPAQVDRLIAAFDETLALLTQ
jgi:glutamate-1-semialdehyde 2,1-aminomutase